MAKKAGKESTPDIPALPDVPISPEQAAIWRAQAAEYAKFGKLMGDELSGKNRARRIAHELRQIVAPAAPLTPVAKSDTTAWIIAEAKRMKVAGEIRADIRITDFAKLLWQRLVKAANADKTLRVVSWRHIKNSLPGWDLWPISSIK